MTNTYFSSNFSDFIFNFYLQDRYPNIVSPHVTNKITNQKSIIKHSLIADKKSRYIIKNIPDYLLLKNADSYKEKVTSYDIEQYKGFLINLKGYKSIEDFSNKQLSKRNIKNLKSKRNKLQKQHQITYKFYYGDISTTTHTFLFDNFYSLLKERFTSKKTRNRYLSTWKHVASEAYKSIVAKRASLFVIFDNNLPICFTLNYHKDDMVFSHIQTFNNKYAQYSLGDITLYNQLEWCFQNNFTTFDLSMGASYYKEKWSNYTYHFNCRLYYNTTSIIDQSWFCLQKTKLTTLQYLRDKNIIGGLFSLDKLYFKIKSI